MTPCFPFFRAGRRLRSGLAAALAAGALLAGCVGDDDAPPAAITAQAAADTAVAAWNTTTTIDVLANDGIRQGATTLDKRLAAVARAPAHGTAMVADGRISYRPRDGFYGSDTLRYTLASADGRATAEAEVAITVEAVLTLAGRAIDAPLAQAAVQISGAASAAATTDAQGAWQATVRLSDPIGVVHISATGSGPQAHVRLVGAAAAADLASAAAPDGTVAAEQVEALTVTHFSTALAALAARAHGGVPGTAAALAEARARVNAEDWLHLATLIHLVADEGLALPAGLADTWALAQDGAAVAALLAAQASADGAVFGAAQARALGAVPAAGRLPTSGTLVAYPAGAFGEAVMVTLAADGTARVREARGSRAARWVQDGDGLTLTLEAPFSVETFEGSPEPGTNRQVRLRLDTTALRLKPLAGGLVELRRATTETRLDGARAGAVRPVAMLDDAGTAQRLAVEPVAAAPLAADDFAVGQRWGGIRLTRFDNQPLGLDVGQQHADLLEITGAGAGRALRTGTTYTVQLEGPAFTLIGSDGSKLQYLRLGPAGQGAWHFATTDLNAPDGPVANSVLVPVDGSLTWTAASASRAWVLEGTQFTTSLPIVLRADGSSSHIGEAATWQVEADGRLRIVRPRTGGRQTRADWIALRRDGDGAVWVLRALFNERAGSTLADDSTPFWFVLRCRDAGPAN